MAEPTEKHAKRIAALIKAKGSAIAITVVGVLIPIVGVFAILIGAGYAFEASGLLKRYPDIPGDQAAKLRSARTAFIVMAAVHAVLWGGLAAVIAIIVASG